MDQKHRQNSLKKKTMLVMIVAFTIVGISSVLLFYKGALDIARSEYVIHCSDIASTVARSLNVSEVEAVSKEVMDIYRSLDPSECMMSDEEDEPGYSEYLAHYAHVKDMKEFDSLRDALRRSQDVAHVECLYLIFPDTQTDRIVYLVDGAHEDIWEPGTLEILYDTDFREEGNIDSGFGSLMSDDEDGGKLVTTAMPIYDNDHHVIAYAGLDYSIDSLLENQRHFMIISILMIALLSAIAAFVVISLVDRSIVQPINALSDASVRFISTDSDESDKMHSFSELDIHTGDEIETLAKSMAKMEQDIDNHIKALLSTKRELCDTREYAEEMARNANKDPLTGVKNKRSYEAAIASLNDDIGADTDDFGIAVIDMNDLKHINDTYGHEHGDEAIVILCRIICNVFKHSPVYRYGGDEFAVILRRHDLMQIRSLIRRFKNDLEAQRNKEEMQPWLKVSAAIGYAIYEPMIDEDANSVFKRADKAMYEDKIQSKS